MIRLLSPRGNVLEPARRQVPTASAAPPSLREAIARSVPLLQRAGPSFVAKAPEGCVSCHNQSLPAMVIALAEQRGFEVDPVALRAQVKATQMKCDRCGIAFSRGLECRILSIRVTSFRA